MSEFGTLLEDKCMGFSIRIVGLCHFLNEEKHEFNIANQMFRSGTSIGANIAEAQCAISRNDFISKLYISLKESNETLYWLRLLYRTRYINDKQFINLCRLRRTETYIDVGYQKSKGECLNNS